MVTSVRASDDPASTRAAGRWENRYVGLYACMKCVSGLYVLCVMCVALDVTYVSGCMMHEIWKMYDVCVLEDV